MNNQLKPSSINPTPPIPPYERVDEETCPGYNPRHFYPGKPGDVLASHYQLLAKFGWGTRSTVWLARDITRPWWQSERTVALKIINSRHDRNAYHERDIEDHITRENPSHRGRMILRTSVENFEVAGTEGNHLCLVFEPMREPLWILKGRFVDRMLPLPIAKVYIYFLLVGLGYLHSECKVVHTDSKLDNILMSFENDTTLPAFVKRHTNDLLMQFKSDPVTKRPVYRCHNNFGPLDGRVLKNMVPEITDFGLSTRLSRASQSGVEGEHVGINPIQPDHYRAPEVILGCGWNFKADIWNIGIWEISAHSELFNQVYDTHGRYDPKSHLAEMIALLGPPPKSLLERESAMTQHDWSCKFLYDTLNPPRTLEDTVPSFEEKEKEAFLSFAREMMTWCPKERTTARELMEHSLFQIEGCLI
ncbi:putative serine/threonine-protein kinase [Aspergillus floccosus]